MTRRASWFSLTSPALLLFCVAVLFASSPGDAAPPSPSLEIDAPKSVEAGQPIEVTFSLRGVTDVGGYETNLLFDKKAGEFASLIQDQKGLTGSGRDVGTLGPVETPRGVSVGAFSCPVNDCARLGEGAQASRGVGGVVELATVTVVPKRVGKLKFGSGATRVVNSEGEPVRLGSSGESFVVQVGRSSAARSYPAPHTAPWVLAKGSSSRTGSSDLTDNGEITNADAMEAALAWVRSRHSDAPCDKGTVELGGDVNQDGCVDVGDLQKIVADYGTGNASGFRSATTGAAPVPDGTSSGDQSAVTSTAATTDGTTFANATQDSSFMVNSTADDADRNAGDGICANTQGACTLRAAIEEANLNAGPDTIMFDIPGSGVQTIQLRSPLPAVSDESGPTTIDGYTQPGSSTNTDPLASNARIGVQLTSPTPYTAGVSGLTVTSPANTIRGLAFFKMRNPVWLYGSGARNNTVVGNFVGTDAAGTYSASSFLSEADGVLMQNGASNNAIGGTSVADRNVVSGNARRGIVTAGETTDSNRMIGNIVGLGPAGDTKLANLKHGVDINSGSSQNQLGGTQPAERNVISGNVEEGVEVSHVASTVENQVVGNFVGTDLTGERAPAYASNGEWGIHFEDKIADNIIAKNVVGNNGKGGIRIGNNGKGNHIYDNSIGVSMSGAALGNNGPGIALNNIATGHKVGPGNVIANNTVGVRITDYRSDLNTITRNSIFGNVGLGIDLEPTGTPNQNDAGDVDSGPNEQLNFPIVGRVTPREVVGTTCGGCTVETFLADGNAGAYGEGKTFLGSAVAGADGSFSVAIDGVSSGDLVTTTATDGDSNTSEFSPNEAVSTASDTTPPETTIGSGPGEGTVSGPSATFVFSSSEAGSAFECSLDGAAFGRCASPKDYANLPDGSHSFKVRAVDAAGNADPTPVQRAWTVDATAPTVQAPEQSLVLGTTLGTSTVPVKLAWSAADDGGGAVAGYELQQSTNGGAYANISLPSATATGVTRSLASGGAYRFRVRAQDGAGNWSGWSEGPGFTVEDKQETDAAISYTGSWAQQALDGAYGGGVRYASDPGSRATFAFTGRNFAWVAPKGMDSGRAEVWVDGVKVKSIDLYASSSQPRKVVHSQDWAVVDVHTVQVRVLGTKNASSSGTRVDVDAFVVLR